jgi:hypothetical protein
MQLKLRSVSNKLKILRSLNARMELPLNEKKYHFKLEKGYQGELMFDQLTAKLQNDMYVLNDLWLEANNTVFQIDTLIISQDTIYPIEVKNYEGDHFYDSESDSFLTLNKTEKRNPLDQLKRCKSLLRQLLHNHGYHLPIEGYVVFVNPEFTFYQAPLNMSMIFPTQLNRFIKKLNEIPSKLNMKHKKLADLLISLHQNESPYTQLPPYTYEQLKKGIICVSCHSLTVSVQGGKCVCNQCGHEEAVESAIIRSVEELRLLFPDRKITTNGVFEWCEVIGSKKRIRRVHMQNFKVKGYGRWFYFE